MSTALKLSVMSFNQLVQEVSLKMERKTGNKFGPKQLLMVQSRLKRRMDELLITEPQDYLAYLYENEKDEFSKLVSLLTTHHTFFFREFQHFEWLEAKLPFIVENVKKRGDRTIHIWSSACSRGQEVWSLAAFLNYHLSRKFPEMDWQIHGTDIDDYSIRYARNGVYPWEEVKKIPFQYLNNHFKRGQKDLSSYAKAIDFLRPHCTFESLNLLTFTTLPREKYDIIFCRNVFIYFDQSTIKKISEKIQNFMYPYSFLFLGLSESLHGLPLKLKHLTSSIYSLRHPHIKLIEHIEQKYQNDSNAYVDQKRVRVVCVDDSPSILTMLKKMLSVEYGFEVVGTAKNGVEAEKVIADLKPDVVTLDIHMPEKSGIEYLQQCWSPHHPPVVMVSSVSREDYATTSLCFKAGASDFVEKPTLANFQQCRDEICSKLKAGVKSKREDINLSLLREFSKEFSFSDIYNKEIWIFSSPSSRHRALQVARELPVPFPRLRLFLSGEDNVVSPLLHQVVPSELQGMITAHPESESQKLMIEGKSIITFVFSDSKWGSERVDDRFLNPDFKIIFEETPEKKKYESSFDVSPFTSFPYLALKYFMEK